MIPAHKGLRLSLILVHRPSAIAVTPTVQSSRCFDPSYSLLGRAIRAWTGDRLRGEAFFIVVLTGLALFLLMSHYLGWALLKPVMANNPSWQMLFWAGQLASVVLWGGLGLVGFRPAVTVTCSPTTLTLEQGGRSRTVPLDEIEQVHTVSAMAYHRHYRRYAATEIFVSTLGEEVLLLRTSDGPVVVALPDPEDHETIRAHLEPADVSVSEPVPQPRS